MKVGDIVKHKAGGPKMTVSFVGGSDGTLVRTKWFIGSDGVGWDLREGKFDALELVLDTTKYA